MIVSFLEPAQNEFSDAINYYESQQQGLGERFKSEASQAILRLSTHPLAYPQLSRRTRRCLIANFPYGIIYQVLPKEIIIIAIAHLHRRSDYWLSRT